MLASAIQMFLQLFLILKPIQKEVVIIIDSSVTLLYFCQLFAYNLGHIPNFSNTKSLPFSNENSYLYPTVLAEGKCVQMRMKSFEQCPAPRGGLAEIYINCMCSHECFHSLLPTLTLLGIRERQ